jgi:UDP-N-acetylmuramoyl-L-alanyl-D-glutamate--2,6-diaminopimelate ligase
MLLSELLMSTGVICDSAVGSIDILSISSDSRQVEPGALFVAIKGFETDGHEYLLAAFERGALAALTERPSDVEGTTIENPSGDNRRLLGILAARFYDYPWNALSCVGITGTNGKTTTAHMIRCISESRGLSTGIMGTVGHVAGGKHLRATMTTPDSLQVARLMRRMVTDGDKACVMEVSSHALSLARVDEVRFDCVLFTNITQDHLDFHDGMKEYIDSKLHLRDLVKPRGKILVGTYSAGFPEIDGALTFGVDSSDVYGIRDVSVQLTSTNFTFSTPEGEARIRLGVPGRVNVYNFAGAMACCMELGASLDECVSAAAGFKGVPGRLEVVGEGREFLVAVDYAHTPDALKRVLEQARELSTGKVIVVFGAGGDRDHGKRPLMGEIAAGIADVTVVTSDNPRTENPTAIINDILEGVGSGETVIVEADRRSAIELAIGMAQKGDVVIIAGKGHEDYQILGRERIHFDDREEARKALGKRGGS